MQTAIWNRRELNLSVKATAVLFFVGLAFFRLTDYPTPWFDEGVHLHVPETLVRYGVYADRSSDGFRYFGPTLGVGPTVMLPIAAAFKVFGIGLLQARVVMALYLLAAIYVFYRFARSLNGSAFAMLALVLLVTCPSIAFIQTGRQVLGEVPAFLMVVAGFWIWFDAWDRSWSRLTLAGLLFGAAAITKYQNLIVLMPTIAIAALLNFLYYRTARMRVFLWPGVLLGLVFALWQTVLVLYLGPSTSAENLAALREASAGAAAVFSPDAMRRALGALVSFKTFGGGLILALPYALICSLQRSRRSQQWIILVLFASVNLVWFVVASIGWVRYAFAGLAISSLFVARFAMEIWKVIDGNVKKNDIRQAWILRGASVRSAIVLWLAAVFVPSIVMTVKPVVRPPENAPARMAEYLTRKVPVDAVIETWEPELGALTEHNYHYPPARLLNVAVRHIWLGGPPPSQQYHPLEEDRPRFVVIGTFSRWVGVYPPEALSRDYALRVRIGSFELYERQS